VLLVEEQNVPCPKNVRSSSQADADRGTKQARIEESTWHEVLTDLLDSIHHLDSALVG
jgi:hypothetical protein